MVDMLEMTAGSGDKLGIMAEQSRAVESKVEERGEERREQRRVEERVKQRRVESIVYQLRAHDVKQVSIVFML